MTKESLILIFTSLVTVVLLIWVAIEGAYKPSEIPNELKTRTDLTENFVDLVYLRDLRR